MTIDEWKNLIYNYYMLENIEFYKNIKKGGDLNYLLYEISNFYDIETKKDFDKEKFLENYFSVLLDLYGDDLDEINIYYDNDLLKPFHENLVAFAYHYDGSIYINKETFKENRSFFADLITLTHEFKHALIFNQNINTERKVGENSNKVILSYNDTLANKFDIYSREELDCIYATNENEFLADMFAYNTILEFIELALTKISKNSIEYSLLNLRKQRFEKLIELRKTLVEKYNEIEMPTIIEKTKQQQEEMFLEIQKEILIIQNNPNYASFDKYMEMINKTKDLFLSFSIYENLEILERIRQYSLQASQKLFYPMFLYLECINYPNYVVNLEDIKNVVDIFKKFRSEFELKDIKIERPSLVENLIKLEFKEYDKNFENYENIYKLKKSTDLTISYFSYLYLKKNKLIKNENIK